MPMYANVREIFSRYWTAYGGSTELIKSPYLHVAIVLTVSTIPIWISPAWWEIVISVLPNLLGFTLGGFAVFLGFGDEKFRALLAEPDEVDADKGNLYITVCSTFVHFITIQVLALVWALIIKAWYFPFDWGPCFSPMVKWLNFVGGFIGFGLFLYALTCVLAVTMHIFRIAGWYAAHQKMLAMKSENDVQE